MNSGGGALAAPLTTSHQTTIIKEENTELSVWADASEANGIAAFSGMGSPASPDRQFCSSTTQCAGESTCNQQEIKEEEGTPRRVCLVCGDVASGFHYGVASCEACKAFFKRTIQGNIEYTCPAANDCEINKRRRKACQACRFQKCLRMGMLKEGVRLDRVRGGRQKYRRNIEGTYQLQPLPAKSYSSLEENKLLEALTLNEPDLSVISSDIVCNDPTLRTLTVLSDLYDQELVKIITWAKHIPGFLELSLNDQMRLLQSTWAELLTLTVTHRSIANAGGLKFAADLIIDEKIARECGFLELYQHCMLLVARQERLAITKEEYYILKALVLANSDVRIEEFPPLKRLRESIVSGLTDCVAVMRPNAGSNHIQHLLLCLPALRQADHLHRRFWTAVHRDNKKMDMMEFEELLLQNDDEPNEGSKKETGGPGRRGRKPGRKSQSDKVDVRAKLERSRQSARECRARKKLRYQYLEELVTDREKAVIALRKELDKYKDWMRELDEGRVPEGFAAVLDEVGAIKDEMIS